MLQLTQSESRERDTHVGAFAGTPFLDGLRCLSHEAVDTENLWPSPWDHESLLPAAWLGRAYGVISTLHEGRLQLNACIEGEKGP